MAMNNENYSDQVRGRKVLKIITWVAIAVIVLVLAIVALDLYADYLEIKEIGENFVPVYLKNLLVRGGFNVGSFVVIFALVYLSTLWLRKNLLASGVEHGVLKNNGILVVACVLISLFASTYMGWNLYEKFLLFQNATSFETADPLFAKDIGYYVFQRPFLMMLIEGFLAVWIFITLYIVAAYAILYFKIGERTALDVLRNRAIVTHIIVNVAVYMVIKALSMWISAQDILFSRFGDLAGGGFVDVNVWLNYYKIAPFILLAITAAAIVLLSRGRVIPAVVTCASYLGILLVVNIIGWGMQVFYVSPNEVAVQAPYIQYNIDYTRKAYGLDQVTETEYNIEENITQEKLQESKETIENIRIIDFPATLTATNQLQGIRNYYAFNDLDVGVYNINGKKQAVAVGPREIAKDNLEDSAKNYINEKFRFTHGYGVVMTSFTSVNSQGQPDYYIKDMVQEPQEGVPYVTQPRVYFGELTNDQVIVNTKTRELDYAEGTSDVDFDYDGQAGIQMNYFNRLLFAFRTGDFRMLIANQITNESRLLLNRNVVERASMAAPFIKFDSDAHIVIDDDGTLKWVVDGYTHTNQYPYAQMTDDFNYIRNSVKAVVDAYEGTVKLYVIDETDPIVNTYRKIYPTLFEQGQIPESVMSKSKYPEWLFSVQCKMYAQYHTTSPTVFYNKNDMYAVANEKYDQEIKPIEPYYNIMQLDEFGDAEPQLVLMLPYTLVNRENMVSWIAAGNEGENYGKLVAYKFPNGFNIYGPLQVENLIDNNPEISKEMTLWNTGGSRVIRGNLLVIPISGTILYIEPVYLNTNNQASLPSLNRIIAAYGDKVVMEQDLATALSKVFDETVTIGQTQEPPDGGTQTPGQTDEEPPAESNVYVDAVVEAYQDLEAQAKSGDWEAFGRALKQMQTAVGELEKNSQ